jgi:hypothetical protein
MGLFVEKKSGGKAAALLSGIGIGAGLMYLLDPERGRLRRAIARDKAVSLANKTGDAVARTSRDIGNRAKGVAAEVRSAFAGLTAEGAEGAEGRREDSARAFSESQEFSSPSASAPRSGATGEGSGRRPAQRMSSEESGRRVEEDGEL